MSEEGEKGSQLGYHHEIMIKARDSGGSEVMAKPRKKSVLKSCTSGCVVSIGEKRGRNGEQKSSIFSKDEESGLDEGQDCGEYVHHELHIWTERERRKKMRDMFANLHELLPQLPSKADKSTIVDEAVSYIKTLEQTMQNLQKLKLQRMHGGSASCVITEPSPMTVVQLGTQRAVMETREAFMADQSKSWFLSKSSPTAVAVPLFSSCFQTWTSPNVVLNVAGEDAHISICSLRKPGMLSAVFFLLEKYKLEVVSTHASSDCFRSMCMIHARASWVTDQFSEALMIEEMYKSAVGEMIVWLSS